MLLVKDDTPLIIICTFSYCVGTKIDEISCENTGGQDSESVFSDYIGLIFCLLYQFSRPFASSREIWTIYAQLNWPKMSTYYSVFHCKQKNCYKKNYLT